ncbi:MAG: hypothetical protein HY321_00700 [Armatimonadetes bacterium]|nr:hypothetical protein [Armatimonadota bacterium]
MRERVWITILILAWAVPAPGQVQDILQDVERAQAARRPVQVESDRPVTLALRRAPLKEVVRQLGEAAGIALACSPLLAEQPITLLVKERPARDVGEALACAGQGRWRRVEAGLVLEPAPVEESVTPAELASALRTGYAQAGAPSSEQSLQAQTGLFAGFTPPQQAALGKDAGLSAALLTPEQRQQLAWILRGSLVGQTRRLMGQLAPLDRLDQATVTLGKPGDYFRVTADGQHVPHLQVHVPGRAFPVTVSLWPVR